MMWIVSLMLMGAMIVPGVGQEAPRPARPDVNKALDRLEFPRGTETDGMALIAWGLAGRFDLLRDTLPIGTPEEEIERVQQWCRSHPNNPEAYYRLGVAYTRAGSQEGVEAVFQMIRRQVRYDPEPSTRYQKEAQAAFQKSVSLFRAVLTERPQDPALWWRLGLALLGAERSEVPEASPDSRKGLDFLAPQRSRYTAAAEALQISRQLDPQFARAYVGLAMVEDSRNDPEKAREWIAKALAVQPDLAYAYAMQYQLVDPFQLLPGWMEAFSLKGDVWGIARAFNLAPLQKAVELAPDHLLYRQNLGSVLTAIGLMATRKPSNPASLPTADERQIFGQAAQHLSFVQQRQPDAAPGVYWLLGLALSRSGKGPEAVRLLQEGFQRYPLHREMAFTLADVQVREGRREEARAVLEEKRKRQAEPADHTYLAYLAYLDREWDRAAEEETKALAEGVSQEESDWKRLRAAAHLGRALVALRQGEAEQAVDELAKVNEADRINPTHYLAQGLAESLRGHQEQAKTYFWWALCDDPEDPAVQATAREFLSEADYQNYLQAARDYRQKQEKESARFRPVMGYLPLLFEVLALLEAQDEKTAEQRVVEKADRWREGFASLVSAFKEDKDKEEGEAEARENQQFHQKFIQALRFVAETFQKRLNDGSLLEQMEGLEEEDP
jgi:tetratricopeptide (TPR) repeat protein